MDHLEQRWDSLLKIHTCGRDDSNSNQYNYPYEPTPYSVLERLAGSGYIRKNNRLLDYGCGKGRADFFLSYQTRCRSTGIEYDERIYNSAYANREHCVCRRSDFLLGKAESFAVDQDYDRFYFFNPFSVEILEHVLAKLLDSYYENPREMLLFFYYPSDEYISCLMTQDQLSFLDEISCMDLFPGTDPRERIMIFEIS